MKLYLASANPGKLREFQLAASSRGIIIDTVSRIQSLPACVEDGQTFEANARKKALHFAAYVKGPVFADDSGICVDALGGAPGVWSARYAGPHATEEDNNRKLILNVTRAAQSEPNSGRHPAHYVCVLALAEDDAILAVADGRVSGLIIEKPRGANGFGYDPYFFYPPLGQTFAELSPEAKFAVSHRGIAFRKLLDALSPVAEIH
ncbi:MAG: RdgB/HAM1 family non-canonical purine NTP pyrophosphatase [Terriglobia bacterium]